MRTSHLVKWSALAALLAMPLTVVASAAVHRSPINAGDQCVRCHRIIFERHVAAEALAVRDGQSLKFRTVRCLLAYLQNNAEPISDVYVTDYSTGHLLNPNDALFVPVPIDVRVGIPNYGLGDTDYLAFKSEHDAVRMAAAYGVATADWPTVVRSAQFLPSRGDAR